MALIGTQILAYEFKNGPKHRPNPDAGVHFTVENVYFYW